MVFSSIPAYLDPCNWQQQPNHQTGASSGASTQLFAPAPPPPPPPPPQPHGSGGAGGSIRPGSMADRARMANIPMAEAAVNCPRCESTNTKFCYFNNYSLSQPRHFCKTCRRYWTRGGALRNVPVGGGCRRNNRRRSKGSSSKSPVNTTDHRRQTAASSGSTTSTTMPSSNNSGTSSDILVLGPQIPSLRFMSPFHHLTNEFAGAEIGYGPLSAPVVGGGGGGVNDHLNFQMGTSALASGSLFSSLSGLDQWRLQQTHQQFPFLGGLHSSSSSSSSPSGLYPFEGGVEEPGYGTGAGHQVRPRISSSGVSQFPSAASVKMEDNHHHHQQQQQQQQELNLSMQFLGIQGNDQYWNNTTTGGNAAAAWTTDLSNFSSSTSTSNPL